MQATGLRARPSTIVRTTMAAAMLKPSVPSLDPAPILVHATQDIRARDNPDNVALSTNVRRPMADVMPAPNARIPAPAPIHVLVIQDTADPVNPVIVRRSTIV
jgi:hypothetical protein